MCIGINNMNFIFNVSTDIIVLIINEIFLDN